MRKAVVVSLVAAAVVVVLAIPADAIYAQRHGRSVTCTAVSMTPRTDDNPPMMMWNCDGQINYSYAAIGELRLLKVGEAVSCVKWRSLILGPIFSDVISHCSRV